MTAALHKTILILLFSVAAAGCAARTYPEKAFYLKSFRQTESTRMSYIRIYELDEVVSDKGLLRRVKGRPLGFFEETLNKIAGTRDVKTIYYVYDNDFNIIGFLFPDGSTFQYEADGYPRQVGVFQKNDGVRTLLKFRGSIMYEELEASEFD